LGRERRDRLEIPDERRRHARRVGQEDVLGGEEVARGIGVSACQSRRERGERRDGGHREPGPRPEHASQRNEGLSYGRTVGSPGGKTYGKWGRTKRPTSSVTTRCGRSSIRRGSPATWRLPTNAITCPRNESTRRLDSGWPQTA